MKKSLTFVIALTGVLLTGVVACDSKEINNVESVSLDETLTMVVGDVLTLEPVFIPSDAADRSVTWDSSEEAFATVDADGNVTALAAGETTITVTTVDGEKTDTCVITVISEERISLDPAEVSLLVGDEQTLVATVLSAGTDQSVTWRSSDPLVATVDETGLVKAVANGEATIRAISGVNEAVCKVLVSHIGRLSFRSTETWTAGDQVWSDAVMAEGAKTTGFNGGASEFYADVRKDIEGPAGETYGDMFSWQAVNLYGDYICPGEWRVPSSDDTIALDKELGGTGENDTPGGTSAPGLERITTNYIGLWGGQYGGTSSGNYVGRQGETAFYWTTTTATSYAGSAYALSFNNSGMIFPWIEMAKGNGFTVRCVKAVEAE